MWPLKVYETPTSEVSKMESLANNYISKVVGLPLPLFRCRPLRLKRDGDPTEVHQARIQARESWPYTEALYCESPHPYRPQAEVDQAITSLKH